MVKVRPMTTRQRETRQRNGITTREGCLLKTRSGVLKRLLRRIMAGLPLPSRWKCPTKARTKMEKDTTTIANTRNTLVRWEASLRRNETPITLKIAPHLRPLERICLAVPNDHYLPSPHHHRLFILPPTVSRTHPSSCTLRPSPRVQSFLPPYHQPLSNPRL